MMMTMMIAIDSPPMMMEIGLLGYRCSLTAAACGAAAAEGEDRCVLSFL
jgi:hypothetical protein